MKSVSLINVSKVYGGKKILDNLNLFVDEGIFFALLGPSGCGKTTLLRIIAGLTAPDSGKVVLGNEDITLIPAYQRKINTVFQQQGLFPHLTVFENIAYGLMVKGTPRDVIREKVERQIKIVNLLGLEKKYPVTLSGGQMQRVALARSLILEPEVLLFDEPLSALDARLKDRMLIECANLQHALKTTFIYITHDREEALTVADKLAIMNFDGKLEQVDSPKAVFQKPSCRFVANFVGDVTIFGGTVDDINLESKIICVKTEIGNIFAQSSVKVEVGDKVYLSIRPKKISLHTEKIDSFANVLFGKISSTIYSGIFMRYLVETDRGINFLVFEDNFDFNVDEEIYLHFHSKDVVVLKY